MPVVLTREASSFKVTVPTVLPVFKTPKESVSSTNVKIVNMSYGTIEIYRLEVVGVHSLEIGSYGTDMTKVSVNTYNAVRTLNSDDETRNCVLLTLSESSLLGIPGNGGELVISYDVDIPTQMKESYNKYIDNVIFTIGWRI